MLENQNPQVLAQLSSWGLTPAQAKDAGLFYTPDASQLFTEMNAAPGLVVPYYDADNAQVYFDRHGTRLPYGRIRWLGTAPRTQGFTRAKELRYMQPAGSPVLPYLAPFVPWRQVQGDVTIPLIITEGEAKALRGCVEGLAVVALGGVFSFTTSANGVLLPALEDFRWQGRPVYIAYDSDAATNPNVAAAEARLVDELQRKRGAHCHIVRLPTPEDGSKVGLDDYISAHGLLAFQELMRATPALTALDRKVLELNRHVAWIERESMVYDLRAKLFIRKEAFTKGSRYSALKHITVSGNQRAGAKTISVAETWLTHSNAQRYDEILFRPEEPAIILGEFGRSALNMWCGYDPSVEGTVKPFLDLTRQLYKNVRAEDRDLPFKLMIYKLQNPAKKIPLALVLLGPEGAGKTMWAEIIRDVFSPYGQDVTPGSLSGDFQGWLEQSLCVVVNEAAGTDMQKAAERLRNLISELRQSMNEKFRPAREVNSYAIFIITANARSVGTFQKDDRRMIVVNAPKAPGTDIFRRVGVWREAGGADKLRHYMLNYDLEGWVPPETAPLSAEKHLAYIESLSPIQRLAEEMQTSGFHTLEAWLDTAVEWARMGELSNNPATVTAARATLANIDQFQIRPWYQPEELALMFPSIVSNILGSKFAQNTPSGQISRELRDAGVPYLVCADDPRGFRFHGRMCQYLVVSGFEEWEQPLKQADFERLMGTWPTYGQLKADRAKK
ncbi:MAG: DUF3854 domain-containing protein [Allgaiera sp.]|nr:DUF3854 domain-containing protein [Allgaiera sp.]